MHPREQAKITIRPARPNELALVTAIDDDASELFAAAGLSMAHLQADHPFVVDAVGFASMGSVDGGGHLDQLSVLRSWMRRGIGRALVAHGVRWAQGRTLWLTTYAHLAWNRPTYEKLGFSVVPEAVCGPDIRAILADERATLPAPEHRVAMRTAG
jgi:GNAT superfamily N-acetyltransferase